MPRFDLAVLWLLVIALLLAPLANAESLARVPTQATAHAANAGVEIPSTPVSENWAETLSTAHEAQREPTAAVGTYAGEQPVSHGPLDRSLCYPRLMCSGANANSMPPTLDVVASGAAAIPSFAPAAPRAAAPAAPPRHEPNSLSSAASSSAAPLPLASASHSQMDEGFAPGIARGKWTLIAIAGVFSLALLPSLIRLLSRIRPARILEQDIRRRVFVYVEAHPASRLAEVTDGVSVRDRKTIAYHLRVLVKNGLLAVDRGRFSVAGVCVDAAAADATSSATARAILDSVRTKKGASLRDVVVATTFSPQLCRYHLKRLGSAGLVRASADSDATRYYAT